MSDIEYLPRMNCWRTTWAARINNLGFAIMSLALNETTHVIPLKLDLSPELIKWLAIGGFILKTIGTEWSGKSAADQKEVKRHLGLDANGQTAAEAKAVPGDSPLKP